MATIAGRFHEVEAWNGETSALPPNPDYVFEIEKVAQEQSSKGTPQLVFDLKVQNDGALRGRTMKMWRTLNFEKEGPRKRIKSLIDATGVPMSANGDIDDQSFVGKTFVADVIHEPYEVADAVTGQQVKKTRTSVQNERPVSALSAVAPAPAAATVGAPQPRPSFPAPGGRGSPLTPVQ